MPAAKPIYDSDALDLGLITAVGRLHAHRELLGLLVLRDLTVRYKRSIIGVWWTLLNPLLTTAVMWVVFSGIFRFAIPGNIPFVVYLLSGVLLVTLFSQGVLATGTSITAASSVLTKVHVPAEVFAVAATLGAAVNFVIGLVVLFGIQIAMGVGVSATAPFIVFLLLFLLALTLGIGLLVATAAVRFDDVVPTVGVLLTVIGYATPTFYPVSIVPAAYLPFLELNPLVAYLRVFRELAYGGGFGSGRDWLVVLLTSTVMLVMGMRRFARSWRTTVVML